MTKTDRNIVIETTLCAEIMYVDLPETTRWVCPKWIVHLESKGISINKPARKLLEENFTPTVGVTRRVALISMQKSGKTCSFEALMREVKMAGLVEPSMEAMCILRNMYVKEDIVMLGSETGSLMTFYPELLTHGEEYFLPGNPQWLGICQHVNFECLYSLPYNPQDELNTNNLYVYEVPVK